MNIYGHKAQVVYMYIYNLIVEIKKEREKRSWILTVLNLKKNNFIDSV